MIADQFGTSIIPLPLTLDQTANHHLATPLEQTLNGMHSEKIIIYVHIMEYMYVLKFVKAVYASQRFIYWKQSNRSYIVYLWSRQIHIYTLFTTGITDMKHILLLLHKFTLDQID